MNLKRIVLFSASMLLVFSASSLAGPIYNFAQITNNGGANIAPQLTVEVLGTGDANLVNYGGSINSDQTLFVFKNNVGFASSITDVYFDDGALLGIASIRQSSGVNFSNPANPANLPGANSITPKFTITAAFSADSSTAPFGVNSSTEWVGILFTLKNGMNYNDVIASIENWSYNGTSWSLIDPSKPDLRIGIHASSIFPTGESNGYINIPGQGTTIVPEPSTLLLIGTGILGFGILGKKLRIK